MPYPPAPWQLQGFSLQALHLLDADRVRPQIPAELKIVSVWPGKTLGGVYVACYQAGSTLVYSELIVLGALVYGAGQVGGWISQIYVDHPDSIAGGREIWGLPKQEAQFDWELGSNLSVQVKQADRLLCSLSSQRQFAGWPQSLKAPVFSQLNHRLVSFTGAAQFKLHFANVRLQVPPESELSYLNLGQSWLGFDADSLRLTVDPPVFQT